MATRKRTAQPYKMRNVGGLLEELGDEPSTEVPVDKIRLPKDQPRKYFDSAKMCELVESVREYGILEPLLVRPLANGEYELVAGERRYRAAKEVGLDTVPIVSRDLNDQDAIRIALVENLQREDLNPVEETEAILSLLTIELNLSKEDVTSLLNQVANAKKRGQELTRNVSRQIEQVGEVLSSIADITPETFRTTRLPLLNLPSNILDSLRQGQIEYTKAKAIAKVKDPEQRQALLKRAIDEGLSLSQIRAEITAGEQTSDSSQSPTLRDDFDRIYGKLKKSDVWNDSKKQNRLKKLMTEIESLLEGK
jgi:ParB family transcriptional regulator, chromosome partitioning protein